MNRSALAAAPVLAALLALGTPAARADTNVALGGTVTLSGAGFGDGAEWGPGSLAAPGTITDGQLLPLESQWNLGSVFWTGDYGADVITVTLGQASVVNSLMIEGDNDNNYGVSYRDTSGAWHALTVLSPNRSWGEDVGTVQLGAPVVATAFAITGAPGAGDYHFSVAEFQAYGTTLPVPEPATVALWAAGLAVLGLRARRQRRG